jgi:hypothetical protein
MEERATLSYKDNVAQCIFCDSDIGGSGCIGIPPVGELVLCLRS